MPSQTLTLEFLETLPSEKPSSGSTYYFDTEITGFALEHRASGNATYYFRYRDAQHKVRLARIGALRDIPLLEARQMAFKMKKMVDDGGDPKIEVDRFRDAPTFAEFAEQRYIPHAKARKRSWASDASLLRRHIIPSLGPLRMHRIRRTEIISLVDGMKDAGYVAGTVNRVLNLCRFMFVCAIRWEVIPPDTNPVSSSDLFPDHGGCERYLSRAEAHRLMAELERNSNRQSCDIVKLLLFTGARKSEIMLARWENVDFERRLLTVPISKSGKARHIALSDAALEVLKSMPRHAGVPWLFYNPKTGRPLGSIQNSWNTIRKRAGIRDVRMHDLRHSFASFLVNSGRSLYEVQKLLGHADAKTTQRYAHLAPGSLIEAANIVGDLVQTKPREAAE